MFENLEAKLKIVIQNCIKQYEVCNPSKDENCRKKEDKAEIRKEKLFSRFSISFIVLASDPDPGVPDLKLKHKRQK